MASPVARLEGRGQLERREHRATGMCRSCQVTDDLGLQETARLRALLDQVADAVRKA
ncbi:hypothetical protein [Streptomyces sp. TRM70350]|uniref:hypothetical protein n=1 Tax=Streptomyces sp. TRM70350 TaxID=2856165 RepID=UPI001C437310|nr:hypothetical protein [Streptomyces sp. TRM70350]MBV7697922.1 hypothetical protein [Streptomyces sp. TRM70350]